MFAIDVDLVSVFHFLHNEKGCISYIFLLIKINHVLKQREGSADSIFEAKIVLCMFLNFDSLPRAKKVKFHRFFFNKKDYCP